MKFFRSRAERELDALIEEIKINLANNYKSTAHAARVNLGRRCEELRAGGQLDEKKYRHYIEIYNSYTVLLKDYHH